MGLSSSGDRSLQIRGRTITLGLPGEYVLVMGILNVTPDSFSDGGRFTDPGAAVERAARMLDEGATIIDVGGESTRPRGATYGEGAETVDADTEKERVLPVIGRIRAELPDAIISIDTYKPDVARAAVAEGADMINDVTGLRLGDEMAEVASEAGAALIVMHSAGPPGAMPHEAHYEDVVGQVRTSLARSVAVAEAAGVDDIVVDPGFGFGKSTGDNFRLIGSIRAFAELGRPVLIGVSRKTSIGEAIADGEAIVPVEKRLYGSLAATASAVLGGASLVRTHDVGPTVDMLRVLRRIVTS